MHESFPNASSLVFGQHGNRTEAVPILATVRNGYRREGYMAHYFSVNFRDKRNSESPRCPQRIDYEVLCLITDGKIRKSRFGDMGDCFDI
jgi:hypothetical protein